MKVFSQKCFIVLSNRYDCCQAEVNIPEELKKAELKELKQVDNSLKRKLNENSLLRDTCQSVPFRRCYDESSAQVFCKCNYSFQCKRCSVKECQVSETLLKPVSCLITDFFFFMSDIKEDYDLSGHVPNIPFPVAACKVTQCSTLAVVCRLKSNLFN